ncbi:MAG: hypothetical protein ACI4XR_01855 [Bacilli bacterium]
MKNKKIVIYIILAIITLLILGLTIYFITNSKSNHNHNNSNKTISEPQNLLEEILQKKGKTLNEVDYKKFVGGEVLNEDTNFIEFAFISNNTAYIFNPEKLKKEELSYKKVYDIPNSINIISIASPYGADISFYDNQGYKYSIKDMNTDNIKESKYEKFENAIYEFKEYKNFNPPYYITKGLTEKYDIRCNMFYAKDNILYNIIHEYYNKNENRFVDAYTEKINGNYEGEKILHIYNDRIVKTDKAFYEVVNYSENNKTIPTTMKISLLSKYYDEVLTFTYEYVILKDYTLIPINDVFVSRSKEYQTYYYVDRFDEKPQLFEE